MYRSARCLSFKNNLEACVWSISCWSARDSREVSSLPDKGVKKGSTLKEMKIIST